ncbi:MAG: gamma-glutamyltransferase [Pseudomonadota bacterium]
MAQAGKGRYAIAAGHPLTAEAGAEVLAAGGTAVDAVTAAAFMAMVAEPVLAGLLGGGFLMHRAPTGRIQLLDMFVDTPGRARSAGEADLREAIADFGGVTQRFHIGAATVAVSGLGPALIAAQAEAGRMPLAELLAPAVAAAREGVVISAFQARLGRIVAPIISATPEARALNCDASGAPLGDGARRQNPAFADVLEVTGIEGADFLARGEVAAGLLALATEGGHLQADDLARWRAIARTPLEAEHAGCRLWLNPAPALGGALIAFPLALLGRAPDPAAMLRALALTAEARGESAIDADATAGSAWLASEAVLSDYRARLRGHPPARRGTTHISAVDTEGGAASLTLSNGEGCGLIVPGTGIMPNNMLGEEDLVPGLAEDRPFDWPRGVRLASMMAPTMMMTPEGRLAVLGSGGSNRIRSALVQVIAALASGTDLETAITAPRLHVEGTGREAQFDYERVGLGAAAETALRETWAGLCGAPVPERGDHEAESEIGLRAWDETSMFFGGVHAVLREAGGGLVAVGDPRRAGEVRSG